jgi:hypothetical protein
MGEMQGWRNADSAFSTLSISRQKRGFCPGEGRRFGEGRIICEKCWCKSVDILRIVGAGVDENIKKFAKMDVLGPVFGCFSEIRGRGEFRLYNAKIVIIIL